MSEDTGITEPVPDVAQISTGNPDTPGGRPPYDSGLNWKWVLLIGALYGLLMRIAFGLSWFQGSVDSGPMLVSFLLLVPFIIGGLSVYLAPPKYRSVTWSIIVPWVPTLAFVGGTAVLLIEGSICIVMALPIFLGMASFGGITVWGLLRVVRPSPSSVGSVLLLPLLAGAFERNAPPPMQVGVADSSVHIAASQQDIWHLINDARAIRPGEMAGGVAWRMGVPYPLEAVTVATDSGRVRKLRWQGGVYFDEPILNWEENRYIRWRYDFKAESFPNGVLDEHVVLGGKHFDLLDTSYRLTPEGDGTRLDIHVTYRVNTRFNWYAGTWARWLIDDAAESILMFYKQRAEANA